MHFRLIFAASIAAFSLGAAAQTAAAGDGRARPWSRPIPASEPEFSGRLASDPNMTTVQPAIQSLRRMRQEICRAQQGDRRGGDRGRQSRRRRIQHLHRRRKGKNRSRKQRPDQEGLRAIGSGHAPAPPEAIPRMSEPASPQAIAQATLDGFNRHYALFRDCAAAAKRHFEAGNWLAISHVSRERIDFYDRRVAETVARLRHEFGCTDSDDARWEEVKRHYVGAADRSQAAGVRRDILQYGVVQDPRSQLLSQPLPVRPPGGLDRAHRRRPAFIPFVLSAPARAAACADRHRARLPSRTALCRFSRRPRQSSGRVPAALSAPVPARGEPSDPGAIEPVLPQSHRLRRRARDQRLQRASVRRADQARCRRPALCRCAADGPRAARVAVLRQPRVLPGRHGGAIGVRRVPAQCRSRAHRGGALHDGGPAETGQDAVLPRFPASPQALDRQLHRRPGHQGPGDDRVHAAVVPVRVQGDPGQDRAVEGHDARPGQGEICAGQAPRPRRQDGGHARIFGRGVSSRPLHAGADRRARRPSRRR